MTPAPPTQHAPPQRSYPADFPLSHLDLPCRRDFLRWLAAGSLAAPTVIGCLVARSAESNAPCYRIGVCDWMLLQRQKPGAISLAAELGADGLEVDMGPLGQRETFNNALAQPDLREQFLQAARQHGIALCSLAMSGFYAQSFAERPGVGRLIDDAIETAVHLGIHILFLPLGVPSDLLRHPHLRPAVVARLRDAARKAETARVIIGVETSLPAAEETQLLDEVGSNAVRSYFNFAQAIKYGRDPVAELEVRGAERIVQIHASNEDGFRLPEDPKLNLPQIKQTLDRMGWRGWLVIERSRDARNPHDLRHNYATNIAYLKQIFQKQPPVG